MNISACCRWTPPVWPRSPTCRSPSRAGSAPRRGRVSAAAARELNDAAAAARRAPPEPAIWAARPRLEGEEQLAPELEVSMLQARVFQAPGQGGQMPQTPSILPAVMQQQRPYNDEVYQ